MRAATSLLLSICVVALCAAALDTSFDRVAAALAAGATAEAVGDRNVLRDAASLLASAGAVPADGQDDLSRRWGSARTTSPQPVPAYRDRALGPAYRAISLPAGSAAVFQQTFLAGQRARIAVIGVRRSDFLLSVTDDGDAKICETTSRAACDWVPPWTTRFKLRVVNSGKLPGTYYLLIQ